jgi:heme A synthase
VRPPALVQWILPAIISVLALADGALHIALDEILFRGNFFGRFGPPPGAAPPPGANRPPGPPIPLPLPLNQMFVLNFVGYVVLVVFMWLAFRRLHGWRWWVDVPLLVYVAVVFLAWVEFGGPNPMGLGYLSKGIEIILFVALLAHIWLVARRPVSASS